jgi:DNA polymerase III epsilon subunit-like protein
VDEQEVPLNQHIMLDLETLSSACNARILSIGAVRFFPEPEDGRRAVYAAVVSLDDTTAPGHIDPRTIRWWMDQQEAARKETFFHPSAGTLWDALRGFTEFCREVDAEVHVWGNGSAFDNVVLRSSYEAMGLEPPWKHKGDMCYRTLKKLRPDIPAEKPPIEHVALADALYQATHLKKLIQALGVPL